MRQFLVRQKVKLGQLSNVSELSDQLINVAELIEIIMLNTDNIKRYLMYLK